MTTGTALTDQDRRDKTTRILALRAAGRSWDEVVAEVDVPRSTARSWAISALKEITRVPAEKLLGVQLIRLEHLLRAVWPYAIGTRSPDPEVQATLEALGGTKGVPPDLPSLDRVLKILHQINDLHGLYPATPVNINVGNDAIQAASSSLASILRDPGARAALDVLSRVVSPVTELAAVESEGETIEDGEIVEPAPGSDGTPEDDRGTEAEGDSSPS